MLSIVEKRIRRKPKYSDLHCLAAQIKEKDLHKQIAGFLALALTDPGIDWETIETSNNNNNQFNQSGRKAKGVKAGTPDILITYNPNIERNLHYILRLEIKTSTGKMQESQKLRIPELQAKGQFVEGVRSVEDVVTALNKYKIPHRNLVI